MKIELWKIADVKPYPGNPRQNDDAVAAVAASLREFGFRQPIVVDTDGIIIAGHTRYKAAQKLGLDKVPVHVATDLTPEQIRAYRIADNQTASLATWDYDLLPIELGALQEANYDLGLLGFDMDELAKLLDPTIRDGLTDTDGQRLRLRRGVRRAARCLVRQHGPRAGAGPGLLHLGRLRESGELPAVPA